MSMVLRLLAFNLSLALAVPGAQAQDSDYAEWFPGSSSTQEVEQFPFGFRGKWAPSLQNCSDADGVEHMDIYPDGIDFYESGGRLARITQSGQDRTVKLKLNFEGEGEFWDAVWLIKLVESGKTLKMVENGKSDWTTYYKCES